MGDRILVVGVDCAEPALLPRLARELETTLGVTAEVLDATIQATAALDPSRNQHNSSLLLRALCDLGFELPMRVLGVSSYDLFAPVLTYVFGEAQLRGPAAVVSTFRLRPERYGLPPDENVLARRLLVEAVHELGHTAGLRHCLTHGCAMNGSTYVEDIDLKGPGLCESCDTVFKASFGPAQRVDR
ncbi:MAG: archemetzincin [Candidatus Zixiibacteriota bacterium]